MRSASILALLALAACDSGGTKSVPSASAPSSAAPTASSTAATLDIPKHVASGAPRTEPPRPSDAAPEEALLLGIRSQDGSLATYFAEPSGLRRIGDGVVVPRKDGFWHLTRVRRKVKKVEDVSLAVAPAGKAPTLGALQADEGCESSSKETLLFAGPDYISLEAESGGMCEGAAHPFQEHVLATFPIAATRGAPVAFGAVLGAPAEAHLKTAGSAARGKDDCLEEPDPADFGLIRTGGDWKVRGGLSKANEACRGQFKVYPIDVAAPKSLTGLDPLPQPWSHYTALDTDVTDAVASPSGRVVLLVTKTALKLRVDDKPSAEIALPHAAIVLAQWALHANVARWRDEVPKAVAR